MDLIHCNEQKKGKKEKRQQAYWEITKEKEIQNKLKKCSRKDLNIMLVDWRERNRERKKDWKREGHTTDEIKKKDLTESKIREI